jgi:putative transposase
MPRQSRLDALGTLHHVIVRGIEKRRIVDNVAERKNVVTRLGKLKLQGSWAFRPWPYPKSSNGPVN